MADNNDNNDEHHSETDEGPGLYHTMKQNSEKIILLESSQKEIMNPAMALGRKIGQTSH